MSPEQINKIVDTIINCRYQDQEAQDASNVFHNALYPDSHNPILNGTTDNALVIVKIMHSEIADWLSYFIYEVDTLKHYDPDYDVVIKQDCKDWKLNTVEDLKTFLISEYALKQKAMEALEENKEILKNLKKRTDAEYNFTGQTQRDYDKGQIDILERILPKFTELF